MTVTEPYKGINCELGDENDLHFKLKDTSKKPDQQTSVDHQCVRKKKKQPARHCVIESDEKNRKQLFLGAVVLKSGDA